MTFRLKTSLQPLAALADQVLLSLLNFAIALAFILGTSKVEYGYYLLLVTPLLLVQSIQNALVISPLSTVLPAASEKDRPALRETASTIHFFIALVAGGVGLIGFQAYEQVSGGNYPAVLHIGFAAAIVGTVAREAQRSFAYAEGRGVRALGGDIAYGISLLAGIGFLLAQHQLTAGGVLLVTGIAGLAPLLVRVRQFPRFAMERGAALRFWQCGRWALPSVVVTWATLNSSPYFAGIHLSIAAVADIGAARLFLMPVALAMTAWSNWYRPRISHLCASNPTAQVRAITHVSVLAAGIGLGLLAAMVIFLYPLVEHMLGEEYVGLRALILMWLVYFALALARTFHMATLMSDAQGYKTLHHISWGALLVSLFGLLAFSANGALWIVGVLCVVEGVQLVLVATRAHRYWKRDAAGEAPCLS